MRRLVVVEAAGKNISFKLFLRKGEHSGGVIVLLETLRRYLVHALIRALRRKYNGNQQFVRAVIFQRGARVGVKARKFFQNFIVGLHSPILTRNAPRFQAVKSLL